VLPRPPSEVRLPRVVWAPPGIVVRGLIEPEPMLGRTLPTVARESEPTPERLNEPGFKFGERMPPLMPGDIRRAPLFKLEGARKLPMLGEVLRPPSEEPPKEGE